jgi:hypothetical protein
LEGENFVRLETAKGMENDKVKSTSCSAFYLTEIVLVLGRLFAPRQNGTSALENPRRIRGW